MEKIRIHTILLKTAILVVLVFTYFGFTAFVEKKKVLKPISVAEFEKFVEATNYKTDAEKYGWSIVQTDLYNFTVVENANWKIPDGINKVKFKKNPVTQVSYNDALAYCKWKDVRLPNYNEYWDLVKNDKRPLVYNYNFPISSVETYNIVGNVWDITIDENNKNEVRLAGGSLYCAPNTCNGINKDAVLFVDKETGNTHIGFSVVVD